jgi:hypothetical protein
VAGRDKERREEITKERKVEINYTDCEGIFESKKNLQIS